LVGVAVKTIGNPWHRVVELVAILTAGLRVGITVTGSEEIGEVAQETKAVTLTLPPVVPANAWMEVPLVVPLHPEGKVQV
jgi:hypothetical protein